MAYVIGIAVVYFLGGILVISLCKVAGVADQMMERARKEDERA